MKEERLMVLSMVNEGKITAEEAAKLLEVINAGPKEEKHYKNRNNNVFDGNEAEEKIRKFTQTVEEITKEFGDKMSMAFKDMEPKFKKAAKVVAEKTAYMADEISKSLNETIKNMETKESCCDENCNQGENCNCNEQNEANNSNASDANSENQN